jgi:hypothetical protein
VQQFAPLNSARENHLGQARRVVQQAADAQRVLGRKLDLFAHFGHIGDGVRQLDPVSLSTNLVSFVTVTDRF